MKVCAEQGKIPNSNIAESEEAIELSSVYLNELSVLKLRRRVGRWSVPIGLVPVQTFPAHIIQFLANKYKDAALFKMCQQIPLSRWSDKFCGLCYSLEASEA